MTNFYQLERLNQIHVDNIAETQKQISLAKTVRRSSAQNRWTLVFASVVDFIGVTLVKIGSGLQQRRANIRKTLEMSAVAVQSATAVAE
jgi:hypothetical protein